MELQHTEIEARVKQFWAENKIYQVEIDTNKPKYYVLDMFPYPSGSGLHVGHPLGYVASDIFARYKRLCGFNVLHTMGWDAFGLPAEQYAIQKGVHPAQTTAENILTYRRQLDNLGLSFDWSREINTSDPQYYKWTQWIVTRLFMHYYCKDTQRARPIGKLVAHFRKKGSTGINTANTQKQAFSAEAWTAMSPAEQDAVLMNYRLAYRTLGYVNWCEALGTVLANDEIVNGVSERGGHPVTKREMYQWNLRVTAYADRLLESLNTLEWSESMKNLQRNWIGKSEGALVRFDILGNETALNVFTTRPDTIFGATFMVVAPEHAIVQSITTNEQREAVNDYVTYVKSRSDIERQQEKKVSGVFTGSSCKHPFTGADIPIYLSEYVLAGYGTGAIMAVPSDDDRDNTFAKHFNLPIIEVVDKSMHPADTTAADKLGKLINSDFLNGLEVKDAIKAAIAEIEKRKIGTKKTNYKLRDANMSRQRYWGEPYPIEYDADGVASCLPMAELPLVLPDLADFTPAGNGAAPLAKLQNWVNEKEGFRREVDTMPGFAGSSWYFLRYMDPHNTENFASKEALDYWQDVDFYVGGSEHAVGHLLYSRTWHKFLYDLEKVPTDEPFRKLVNQGMIQGISQFISVKMGEKTVDLHVPINFVNEKGRLTYSRFLDLQKEDRRFAAINDEAIVWHTPADSEMYANCRAEVEKMSKSKYNVINPDDLVAESGADVFRMFEMFLGPIEQSKPFDTKGMKGVEGFVRKFWQQFFDANGNFSVSDEPATAAELKVLHTCIKKVTDDVQRFSMNTCVSAMMICVNGLKELKCNKRAILHQFVVLIAPFAPFISEELWHKLGNTGSVHRDGQFPLCNEAFLVSDTIDYPVQFNGKKKHNIFVPASATKEEIEQIALNDATIQKLLAGATPKKIIVVMGRLISLVV
ncbi:MAG: hypothetical protein RI894_805 [Bacteroidota bacterium]|jgi:leucyl-tRNA synthetase